MSEWPPIETGRYPGPIERRPWERAYHLVFRTWSDRVVKERLFEYERVRRVNQQRLAEYVRQHPNHQRRTH